MSRSFTFFAGVAGIAAALLAACSAKTNGGNVFGSGGGASTVHAASTTGSGGDKMSSTGDGLGGKFTTGTSPNGSGGGAVNCNSGPNDDADKDGWTPAQGDCNDCDPNVNPGAVDVPPEPNGDGGMTMPVDSDCNGKFDPPAPCDATLALDDVTPMDGAKAIDLCNTAMPNDKKWGVISAAYVRADGGPATLDPTMPQVGIQPDFGPNVKVQGGKRMLLLSAGTARTPSQPGACGTESCGFIPGNAPSGFPQNVPGCSGGSNINEDIGLDLKIRAPSNATGFKFNFKF